MKPRAQDRLERMLKAPAGMATIERYPFPTLPDYLRKGMDLVFVGINPGLYSLQKGHYFARPTSRFWPAFSRSLLSVRVRAALGREMLRPADDAALLRFGIGFTDVVKKPSRNAAALHSADFKEWAPRLRSRLETFGPRVACFHGVTAFRGFARNALAESTTDESLGIQTPRVGPTHLFVVPNPSPANAHYRLEDQVAWYDRLAEFLITVKGGARVVMDAETAFQSIVETLRKDRQVGTARMFGAEGLKVRDKYFAMLYKGRLVVKLPKERVEALVKAKDGVYFDPGHGRLMKEWAAMRPGTEGRWLRLAEEARDFVESTARAAGRSKLQKRRM